LQRVLIINPGAPVLALVIADGSRNRRGGVVPGNDPERLAVIPRAKIGQVIGNALMNGTTVVNAGGFKAIENRY